MYEAYGLGVGEHFGVACAHALTCIGGQTGSAGVARAPNKGGKRTARVLVCIVGG